MRVDIKSCKYRVESSYNPFDYSYRESDAYYKVSKEDTVDLMKEAQCIVEENAKLRVENGEDSKYYDAYKGIRDWHDCFRHGVDGYLICLLFNIINKGLYKKSQIKKEFFKLTDDFFVFCTPPNHWLTGKKVDQDIESIFERAWLSRIRVDKVDFRFGLVKEYASLKQPIWRRIVNSNKFMLFYASLVLALSLTYGWLGFFVCLAFFFLCFEVFLPFNKTVQNAALYMFLFVCFLFCILFLGASSYNEYEQIKDYAALVAICFSYFVVLRVNEERNVEEKIWGIRRD